MGRFMLILKKENVTKTYKADGCRLSIREDYLGGDSYESWYLYQNKKCMLDVISMGIEQAIRESWDYSAKEA